MNKQTAKSQAQWAEEIGIDQSVLSHIMREMGYPTGYGVTYTLESMEPVLRFLILRPKAQEETTTKLRRFYTNNLKPWHKVEEEMVLDARVREDIKEMGRKLRAEVQEVPQKEPEATKPSKPTERKRRVAVHPAGEANAANGKFNSIFLRLTTLEQKMEVLGETLKVLEELYSDRFEYREKLIDRLFKVLEARR